MEKEKIKIKRNAVYTLAWRCEYIYISSTTLDPKSEQETHREQSNEKDGSISDEKENMLY